MFLQEHLLLLMGQDVGLKLLLCLLKHQKVELRLVSGLLKSQPQASQFLLPVVGGIHRSEATHRFVRPKVRLLHVVSAALSRGVPQLEQHSFGDLAGFRTLLEREWSDFETAVRDSLRLIALRGIRDPLDDRPIAASDLRVAGTNFRESLEHGGLVSRHRAVLLVLRKLIDAGQLSPLDQLRGYLPEAVTPFARRLQPLLASLQTSEYLPDPAHPLRRTVRHEDLCRLSYADASFDLVLCNDVLEHVYDLEAALAEMGRVLAPGGHLIGTVPFLYSSQQSLVKARHRGESEAPELLTEPEYHGDPVNPKQGSLVYRYPGWEFFDQLRAAGFAEARQEVIHAPAYGVVGAEMPYVLVFVGRRPESEP